MTALRASRILVVADEPALRDLLTRLLEYAGYYAVAADLDHGFSLPGQARLRFDLIIVNSYDPTLTADETVCRMGALFAGVPVMHLDEVCRGPFSIDGLLHVVHQLTRRKARRRTSGAQA
jgi:CheY-like chemotaxis protein